MSNFLLIFKQNVWFFSKKSDKNVLFHENCPTFVRFQTKFWFFSKRHSWKFTFSCKIAQLFAEFSTKFRFYSKIYYNYNFYEVVKMYFFCQFCPFLSSNFNFLLKKLIKIHSFHVKLFNFFSQIWTFPKNLHRPIFWPFFDQIMNNFCCFWPKFPCFSKIRRNIIQILYIHFWTKFRFSSKIQQTYSLRKNDSPALIFFLQNSASRPKFPYQHQQINFYLLLPVAVFFLT